MSKIKNNSTKYKSTNAKRLSKRDKNKYNSIKTFVVSTSLVAVSMVPSIVTCVKINKTNSLNTKDIECTVQVEETSESIASLMPIDTQLVGIGYNPDLKEMLNSEDETVVAEEQATDETLVQEEAVAETPDETEMPEEETEDEVVEQDNFIEEITDETDVHKEETIEQIKYEESTELYCEETYTEDTVQDTNSLMYMRCTAYCDDGYTASGEYVRTGIVAGKKEWLGKHCDLYRVNSDGSCGEFIGTFDFLDTGYGINGSLINGTSIDVWRPDLDSCYEWIDTYGDYVYIVIHE